MVAEDIHDYDWCRTMEWQCVLDGGVGAFCDLFEATCVSASSVFRPVPCRGFDPGPLAQDPCDSALRECEYQGGAACDFAESVCGSAGDAGTDDDLLLQSAIDSRNGSFFGPASWNVDTEENCRILRDNILNQTCKSIRNLKKRAGCIAAAWATYFACLAG